MLRLICTLLFFLSLHQAQAVCEILSRSPGELHCMGWKVQNTFENSSYGLVLTAPDRFQMRLEVSQLQVSYTLPEPGGEQKPYQPGSFSLLKKFNFERGQRPTDFLTASDIIWIEQIRAWIVDANLANHFPLLDFFVQLPANESLTPLMDSRGGEVPWPLFRTPEIDKLQAANQQYTLFRSICYSIGNRQTAHYHVNNRLTSRTVVVGDAKTECFGRCGRGCAQSPHDRNQYTQECLNHDLCFHETGQNLGVCTPFFFKAVDGFLLAPDCNF